MSTPRPIEEILSADLVGDLQRVITRGGENAFNLAPKILGTILELGLWKDKIDKGGVIFTSFEAFATAPLWHGLESSIDDLLLFCRKFPDVQGLIRREMGVARAAEGGRPNKDENRDNVPVSDRGNSSTHALRRLKRDNPDIAERVVKGELTANAAAIEAGFRKPVIQIKSGNARKAAERIMMEGKDYATAVRDVLNELLNQ